MAMAKVDWKPIQIYCLNCAQKLTGYKNADGKVRFVCPRCKVVMVSQMKDRTAKIKVELP